MARSGRVIPLIGLAVLVSGCALGRDVLDVRVPVPPNASAGPAVKVVRVTDQRTFEAKPQDASTPSLKEAADISDKAITVRAIARKRGGYGMALGDIVLPEGQTVEGLVKDAVVRSLRESGYRVVDAPDAAFATATPLEADIDQFWLWFSPGAFTVDIRFRARVRLTGDLPGLREDASPLTGDARSSSMAATSEVWRKTTSEGIEDLVKNIKQRLGSAR
jgi:hypothetical protein